MITTPQRSKITFGTKAETLARIADAGVTCNIPPFMHFNLEDWCREKDVLLSKIQRNFDGCLVAVRSSAIYEDGNHRSYAGAFQSFLGLAANNADEITRAIEGVFASYPQKDPKDQVLIQEMVQSIDASGVILTRCVDDGSPYYVLSYDDETGSSDSVTSGAGKHKTVLVYRNFKPEYCDSDRIRMMLALVQEIEELCGHIPLDIEFALDTSGIMHLLQARRISTVEDWHPDAEYQVSRLIPQVDLFTASLSERRRGLFGKLTLLGNMPDWNPAELIGVVPSPLAASLFRYLITSSAWSEARAQVGYRRLPKTELMVIVGGRAFIDVRASFNSFLPEGIADLTAEKLVNAWLERLASNPSLHDKIEFEVVPTIRDFTLRDCFLKRFPDVLTESEYTDFEDRLTTLTNRALDPSPQGTLSKALFDIDELATRQTSANMQFRSDTPEVMAAHIGALLDDCYRDGTTPFSIIARHAFIAETLLRSAVRREAWSEERLSVFKSSIETVMGELAKATEQVCAGEISEKEFMERFGHLRPGTFDILSPCYSNRNGLFRTCVPAGAHKSRKEFQLNTQECHRLNQLLRESGIHSVDATGLLDYAIRAIKGREYAKYVFTRSLSAVLEGIASWGSLYGLGRKELSFLKVEDILDNCYRSDRLETTSLLMQKVDQARLEQSFAHVFRLSYLVRNVRDIHVVPVHRSEPNYVTNKSVEGSVQILRPTTEDPSSLEKSIVCIENADPGFDWIFTRGIAGLITKYGGANSHMSIRCAELQLPAAIGCGEELFERLRESPRVRLDCGAGVIRFLEFDE